MQWLRSYAERVLEGMRARSTRASAMAPAGLLARCDAVLVDLDGTLVDSAAPVRRVWGAFASRHELDEEAVLRFGQGRPSRETIRLLVPNADHDTEAVALEHS